MIGLLLANLFDQLEELSRCTRGAHDVNGAANHGEPAHEAKY